MTLKTWEIISVLLLTLVSGMYWGPWLALTRSMNTFEPEIFLAVVQRLAKNMAPIMTFLTPIALLSTLPVLFLAYGVRSDIFYLTLAALFLFVFTLIVTMSVEVPIVMKIVTWTPTSLPENWQELRDRWGAFHLLRVIPSLVGLSLMVIGATL